MMGRDTPSPGLDMTAQYVADQFKSFGLKPGGENGTWFQRYDILQVQFDPAESHVGFMAGGKHVHAEFTTDARFMGGTTPDKEIGGRHGSDVRRRLRAAPARRGHPLEP